MFYMFHPSNLLHLMTLLIWNEEYGSWSSMSFSLSSYFSLLVSNNLFSIWSQILPVYGLTLICFIIWKFLYRGFAGTQNFIDGNSSHAFFVFYTNQVFRCLYKSMSSSEI
jgi:hypothetical protein